MMFLYQWTLLFFKVHIHVSFLSSFILKIQQYFLNLKLLLNLHFFKLIVVYITLLGNEFN